jgi:hypothetical protein
VIRSGTAPAEARSAGFGFGSPSRREATDVIRRVPVLLALAALGLAAVPASMSPAQQPAIPTLPLSITVADHEGASVVSDAWIEAQVENANTLFTPHGVSFRVVGRASMDGRHARLETRRDRHALGALLHTGVIDAFIVLSLRDVDDPSRYRQGVHWRPLGGYPRGAHVVIVSSIAGPTVLAHELGHYFGNGHSDVPGNIMSYERGEVPPFFDEVQARRIRASARRFLGGGELRPATAGAPRR